MAKQITHVRKDYQGNITAVGAKYLWEHSIATAISNAENRWENYYVLCPQRAEVVAAIHPVSRRKFLKTTADTTTKNNLDNLPPL